MNFLQCPNERLFGQFVFTEDTTYSRHTITWAETPLYSWDFLFSSSRQIQNVWRNFSIFHRSIRSWKCIQFHPRCQCSMHTTTKHKFVFILFIYLKWAIQLRPLINYFDDHLPRNQKPSTASYSTSTLSSRNEMVQRIARMNIQKSQRIVQNVASVTVKMNVSICGWWSSTVGLLRTTVKDELNPFEWQTNCFYSARRFCHLSSLCSTCACECKWECMRGETRAHLCVCRCVRVEARDARETYSLTEPKLNSRAIRCWHIFQPRKKKLTLLRGWFACLNL